MKLGAAAFDRGRSDTVHLLQEGTHQVSAVFGLAILHLVADPIYGTGDIAGGGCDWPQTRSSAAGALARSRWSVSHL
jgi:hypothetical protein